MCITLSSPYGSGSLGVDYGAGSYPGGETSSDLWTLLERWRFF